MVSTTVWSLLYKFYFLCAHIQEPWSQQNGITTVHITGSSLTTTIWSITILLWYIKGIFSQTHETYAFWLIDACDFLSPWIWLVSVTASEYLTFRFSFILGQSIIQFSTEYQLKALVIRNLPNFFFSAHMNSVLYMQQTGTMGHSAKAKRRREYVSTDYMCVCVIPPSDGYCK